MKKVTPYTISWDVEIIYPDMHKAIFIFKGSLSELEKWLKHCEGFRLLSITAR